MPYTYTSGQGLSAFDPNSPDGATESVAVLDEAIRQLVAYLTDTDDSATGGPNARISKEIEDRETAITDEEEARAEVTGDLADLDTTDDDNLVEAINEVFGKITTDIESHQVETTPKGTIVMFNGGVAPAGWRLCNGSGTYLDEGGVSRDVPDLREKFIVAAGSNIDHLATGGDNDLQGHSHPVSGNTDSHTLTITQMPSHQHNFDTFTGTPASTAVYGLADNQGRALGAYQDVFTSFDYNYTALKNAGGGDGHSHSLSGNTGNNTASIDNRPAFVGVTFYNLCRHLKCLNAQTERLSLILT